MNVYGELTRAQAENLTADPSPNSAAPGRMWWRTDTNRMKVDTGSNIYAALLNDPNIIVGLSGTASQNVRIFRAANGLLQLVLGNDSTVDGSLSTAPAQLSFIHEKYATGSLPAAGNAGRVAYDTTLNQLKVDNGTSWTPIQALVSAPARNYLINSALDFWQRGTSITVATGNPTYGYVADRWYIKNANSGATLTGAQIASGANGSIWDLKCTYGAGASVNGMECYQVLENTDSLMFYGQTASFSVLVKAVTNVTQVGVQLFYHSSSGKLDTAIGSEVLTTVSTSGYTACTISGQAVGTSQTTSGVIGVRIRATAVSTGNIYDIGNGFQFTQAVLNLGSTASVWQRAGANIGEELRMCQRFYEKSYELTTAPGSNTTIGAHIFQAASTSAFYFVKYIVAKYQQTGPTAYSTSGTSGKVRDITGAADVTVSLNNDLSGYSGGFEASLPATATDAHAYAIQWTVDAEI